MEKEIADQMANGNFILLSKSSIPREATVLNSMVPGPVNVAFWQHLLHIFDRFSVFVKKKSLLPGLFMERFFYSKKLFFYHFFFNYLLSNSIFDNL